MLARQERERNLDLVEAPKAGGSSTHLNVYTALGLAFVLRILLLSFAYFYTRDVTIFCPPGTDSGTYIVPAQELIRHHRFFAGGGPEISRTPGYPLLLAPGLWLGHLIPVTILLQILLSCFTVYVVYKTALLLFNSERIATVAAVLYAIEPLSVLYTGVVTTECLFAALVMMWLYLVLRYLGRPRLCDLLFSGIVLAASVYVRPVAYFLPVLIAAGLLGWILVSTRPYKRRLLLHVVGFLIMSMGLIVPWQIRNGAETGYFGFSAIAPIEMYFDKAASVLALQHHVPYHEMQQRLGYEDDHVYLALHPEQKTWPTARRLQYISSQANHILLRSPLTYARVHAEAVVRIVLDPGAIDYLRLVNLYPKSGLLLAKVIDLGLVRTISFLLAKQPLVFWSSAILAPVQLLLLACACVGLVTGVPKHPETIAAMLVAAYFVVISGGPGAVPRYRHPAMPIICIFAGYGLWFVLDYLMMFTHRKLTPVYVPKLS